MVHGNIEVMKFSGKNLGVMQITGVGDKVVPMVRDIIRPELKSTECIVVHFMNHITHKGAFTEEVANKLREAIRNTPVT